MSVPFTKESFRKLCIFIFRNTVVIWDLNVQICRFASSKHCGRQYNVEECGGSRTDLQTEDPERGDGQQRGGEEGGDVAERGQQHAEAALAQHARRALLARRVALLRRRVRQHEHVLHAQPQRQERHDLRARRVERDTCTHTYLSLYYSYL